MKLMALDASSTAVGWALFDQGEYQESGVFVPSGLGWWERVARFGDWLSGWLTTKKVAVVGYELATGRHGNLHTDRVLGAVEYEARRVARTVSGEFTTSTLCEFITVTASQVKATGICKDNLRLAEQLKGAELDEKGPGDEADAMGVGLAVWGQIKEASWLKTS